MNHEPVYIVIVWIGVDVCRIPGVFLKVSAGKKHKNVLFEYLNPWVIMGYFLLFSTTLVNVYAYRGVDYKLVPVMETLSFVFVLAFSRILFREKLTARKIVGAVCIMIGILLSVGSK